MFPIYHEKEQEAKRIEIARQHKHKTVKNKRWVVERTNS